jgi:hypothetical protein
MSCKLVRHPGVRDPLFDTNSANATAKLSNRFFIERPRQHTGKRKTVATPEQKPERGNVHLVHLKNLLG